MPCQGCFSVALDQTTPDCGSDKHDLKQIGLLPLFEGELECLPSFLEYAVCQ
jgi:hypothetical protein